MNLGNVVIICGASHLEEVLRIVAQTTRQPVNKVTLHDYAPSDTCTNHPDNFAVQLKAMAKVCELPELYCPDELQAAKDGIADLCAWLAHHVQQVLAAARRPRETHAILFQPCWSSRRWKSLT